MCSPLLAACSRGHKDVVQLLLRTAAASVNVANKVRQCHCSRALIPCAPSPPRTLLPYPTCSAVSFGHLFTVPQLPNYKNWAY